VLGAGGPAQSWVKVPSRQDFMASYWVAVSSAALSRGMSPPSPLGVFIRLKIASRSACAYTGSGQVCAFQVSNTARVVRPRSRIG
jgi:hypothetical protein